MKKNLFLLTLFFAFFWGINTSAIEPEIVDIFSNPQKVGTDCFDYYKFQSVQVNVGPNKGNFTSGETVDFFGKIENQNTSPVFNGYVYVRIAEKNLNYLKEGHNIVDEFIALGPIAIDASSSKAVSFSWKIPENIKSGEYTADYFFSVNKKFNLGGLPFTNEIIVGNSYFNIASSQTDGVRFDKSGTKVNNKKYNHIGEWPSINKGERVSIFQPLVNSTKREIVSEVTYSLYFWDSLNQKDLISSKKENIKLKAGETKNLTYEIPKVEESIYYLEIIAQNSDGTKSIVNIRVTSNFGIPRINYFGLNNFPLEKGATSTLFFCYHNTYSDISTSTIVLTAKDMVGNEIAKVKYAGSVYSAVSAEKMDFTALSKLDYIKLEQKLYDKNANLIDQEEIVYDSSLIKESENANKSNANIFFVYITIVLIVICLLLFSIKSIRRNKNLCLIIFAMLIILIFVLTFELFGVNFVGAQSTINNFQKSQSKTVAKPFSIGYSGGAINEVFKGSAQYVYTIETTASSSIIKKGDTIGFIGHSLGEFNGVGGSMDTPFFGQTVSYSVPGYTPPWIMGLDAAKWEATREESMTRKGMCVGGTGCVGGAYGTDGLISAAYKSYYPYSSDSRWGYRKVPDVPQLDAIISDNNLVIDCTSGICNAVGVGKATISARILPSEVVLGYSYPIAFQLYKEKPSEGYRESILFEGFTATWEFEVFEDNKKIVRPERPICTENSYLYGDWGECIDGLRTRLFAISQDCPGATNEPIIKETCCSDQYTYSWTECGSDDVESIGTPSLLSNCIDDKRPAPENKTRPCPGHTIIHKNSICTASQDNSNKISVNKQMQWKVNIPSDIISGYVIKDTKWNGTNIMATTTNSSNIINKIYTTVGMKNISATTTVKNGDTTYIVTCSTSTNVILGGSGINEI